MPFTDADGNPITCHTCPFKINTDCTAMPPTPSTNALTMQVWNYPPARNPCLRHPALGGFRLPEGVAAVLGDTLKEAILSGSDVVATADVEAGDAVYITPGTIELEPTEPINPDDVIQPANDQGIAGTPTQQRSRTRASRATARPATEGGNA